MKEESPTSGKFHQFVRNALIRRAEELCYAKLFVKKENEITFRNTDLVVCLGAGDRVRDWDSRREGTPILLFESNITGSGV